MDDLKRELLDRLEPLEQTRVLRFWDDLTPAQREKLASQVRGLDLQIVLDAKRSGAGKEQLAAVAARAKAPPAIRLDGQGGSFSNSEARERGEAALRDGQFGLVLVAGGQGTRLGFKHPKGMFPIGPVSQSTLFGILIARLRAVGARYGSRVPLYLMTSPATHAETLRHFQEQGNYGLADEDLHVFCQGVMPAVDAETSQLLLSAPDELFLAPDGHGGMLAALSSSGGLQSAADRGIKHFFYCQVDNPLAQICDPTLIGHHLLAESEMTTQVVHKRHATERVGNVVAVDDRVQIIEYSDLPVECAEQTTDDGALKLWAGNIAVHVFAHDFLQRASANPDALPLHRAHKATPHLNDDGQLVEPDRPNAYKFERFIFDLLPSAKNAIAVEAEKDVSFAPVKNANGAKEDTPQDAQKLMIRLHSRWLEAAGAKIDKDVPVEINPLWALDAEQVADRLPEGTHVQEPRYFV